MSLSFAAILKSCYCCCKGFLLKLTLYAFGQGNFRTLFCDRSCVKMQFQLLLLLLFILPQLLIRPWHFMLPFSLIPVRFLLNTKLIRGKSFSKSKCQKQSIKFKEACESLERLHFCINILEWQDCMSTWLKKGHQQSMICLLSFSFFQTTVVQSRRGPHWKEQFQVFSLLLLILLHLQKSCNCPLGSFLSPIDSACRASFSWPFLVSDVFGEQM